MDVRSSWNAFLRDVVILDPVNAQPVAAFNLQAHDLAEEANRNDLKALLRSAAELKDEDEDGLCDFWEDAQFGGDRSSGPADNPDRDGAINLLEYAHGSDPGDAASQPQLPSGLTANGESRHLFLTFRQRLGAAGGLQYIVEAGDTLDAWAGGPTKVVEVSRVNPYDGTGTEIVTVRTVQALSTREFLRVQCTLP